MPLGHQQGPQRALSTPLPPHPTALTLKQACSHPVLDSETKRTDADVDTATSPSATSHKAPQEPLQPALLAPALSEMLASVYGSGSGVPGTQMMSAIPASAAGAGGLSGMPVVPMEIGPFKAGAVVDLTDADLPTACVIEEEPVVKQEVHILAKHNVKVSVGTSMGR